MSFFQQEQPALERVPYCNAQFPVYAEEFPLSVVHYDSLPMRVHEEIEFTLVAEGEMGVAVEEKRCSVQAGQCILINPNRPHCHFSCVGHEGLCQSVLIHPSFFRGNELIFGKYIEPLIDEEAPAYRILDSRYEGDCRLIEALRALHGVCMQAQDGWELEANALAHAIVRDLHSLFAKSVPVSQLSPRFAALRSMLAFIRAEYAHDLSLAEIAAAGLVSKSGCSAIFREYLQDTPISYLNSCRLEQSAKLLCTTDLSVTDIASSVGFSSQSYFSEVFRRRMGKTPREYRAESRARTGRGHDGSPA